MKLKNEEDDNDGVNGKTEPAAVARSNVATITTSVDALTLTGSTAQEPTVKSEKNQHQNNSHPKAPATSLSRNSTSGPFKPKKQLGPDVVVMRGVSKRYHLPGREEEVVALRSIDLTPFEEGSAASPQDHIGPIRQGEFVMIRGPSGGGQKEINALSKL